MPQWVFLHTKDAFTAEDKENISKGMAKIYTNFGIPGFLAHCQFIDVGDGNFWSGGVQSPRPSTTISIYHAAANVRNTKEGVYFLKHLDDVVRPVLKPKGIVWESNVYETPPDLWRLQGMPIPAFGTERLDRWLKEDKFTEEDEEDLLRQQGYHDPSRWKTPTSQVSQ